MLVLLEQLRFAMPAFADARVLAGARPLHFPRELAALVVGHEKHLGNCIVGVGHREASRRVRAALDQVGLLHKEKQNPETLSAGEQQRIGIARAIVTRPKLLIADEPTGNLDPDLSLEVMRIFRRFNEVGVTLLIASHDISLIDRLGCRRIALEDGRLQQPEEDEWL